MSPGTECGVRLNPPTPVSRKAGYGSHAGPCLLFGPTFIWSWTVESPGLSPLHAALGRWRLPERRALSRGLALATPPHVAALVTPSARVRRRANRSTHRGLSRKLRRSQCWACSPQSRWIAQRYRSAQPPERVRECSTRERCESAEVERSHVRNHPSRRCHADRRCASASSSHRQRQAQRRRVARGSVTHPRTRRAAHYAQGQTPVPRPPQYHRPTA